MALDKVSLSSRLRVKLADLYKITDAPTPPDFCTFCDAIASAVVDEIKANAVVVVTDVKNGKDIANGTIT